jgi:hypothetical protein
MVQATDLREDYTSRGTPGNSMAKLDHADETLPTAFPLVGQQRSDQSALLRQEMFRPKFLRVAARTFFVAGYR